KPRLPEPMADARDGRCTAPVVGRRDRPATSGPHPKHVEKAAADERAVDALLEAAVRQVEAVPLPAPGECRFGPLCLAIANLLPERVGELALEHDEPIGLVHGQDRKSTRLNSSHVKISYAVFCLKKKKTNRN